MPLIQIITFGIKLTMESLVSMVLGMCVNIASSSTELLGVVNPISSVNRTNGKKNSSSSVYRTVQQNNIDASLSNILFQVLL